MVFSTHIYQNVHNYTPFNFSVIAIFHYQLNLGKPKWTTGENWIIISRLFELTENRLKFCILIFILKVEGFFET